MRSKEVRFRAKDWNGRYVVLLKQTVRDHISRFHLEESFVIESLKEQFDRPLIVVENRGAGSEQAIYEIEAGGHRYLQVNVKYRGWLRGHLVVTLYGVDEVPQGRVLWTRT